MSHHLPTLGIAHFTCINLPPVELARLAGRTGFARVGLRLHPAFPGAPTYSVPAGSQEARELAAVLDGEGITVHDVEFVVIDEAFRAESLERTLADAAALGASRLSVCGDDLDRARLVANFADLCDRAASYGLAVDLECMAWRRVGSLPVAAAVVEAAGRPNAGVLVDALHVARGGSTPDDVHAIDPSRIRHAQLCDAHGQGPETPEGLVAEARAGRLLPGEGQLPLRALVASLPPATALSVEVPMAGSQSAEEHALAVFEAAQTVLSGDCSPATAARR